MATSMSFEEKARLERLTIGPNDLAFEGGTNPFNRGRRIFKYRPSELKFTEGSRPTQRTEDFRGRLISLAGRLGGHVPCPFRLSDGSARSLDAGCLGFLYHRQPPEIAFDQDTDGFITGVRLLPAPDVATGGQNDHYTIVWLIAQGMEPAMAMLIEAAGEGGVVTYGQLADRLRAVLDRPSISPQRTDFIVSPTQGRRGLPFIPTKVGMVEVESDPLNSPYFAAQTGPSQQIAAVQVVHQPIPCD